MTQKRTILLYFLIFLLIGKAKIVQAQTNNSLSKIEEPSLSKKELRKQIPKYYKIAPGVSTSSFRDFATSPLIYRGAVPFVSVARLKLGDNRETEFGFSNSSGAYKTKFNDYTTISKVTRVEFYYSQLYKIGLINSEKYNAKAGFLLTGNFNIRKNPSLLNNGAGIEAFANLLGSIKITRDISRTSSREKKFLFVRYKLKERKRNLAFRLNIGLVNSSLRNGYAYLDQSGALNDPKVLDDYKFKIFSGFKASSSLDYTVYLKNKNAFQISYVWDAYSTGGDLDKFEMAHHVLRFALLFNSNNR